MDQNHKAEPDQQRDNDELARLLERAQKGDHSVLPQLRQALDANPDLWRNYGDLALQAEGSLIQLAAGTNLLLGESLQRRLEAMKNELGGGSPSPLERLLVERITSTWLQVTYYDALTAQTTGASEARARMIQRQQDAAHRRHLAALKTLATVRKLLLPAPSPIEIASRLAGQGAAARRGHMGIAGTVGVSN